jgi:hypothetical protein
MATYTDDNHDFHDHVVPMLDTICFDTRSIPLNDSEIIISVRSRQSSHNNLHEFCNEHDYLNGQLSKYNSNTGYGYGSVGGTAKELESDGSGKGRSGSYNDISNLQSTSDRSTTGSDQQHSVLYKLSSYTLPFVIILYFILQSCAGYFTNVCTEPYHLDVWVRHVHLATIIWFSLHIFYNVYYMSNESNWKSSEAFYAYAHGLCILFIVLSSTILSVTQQTPWTTLCRDGFG